MSRHHDGAPAGSLPLRPEGSVAAQSAIDGRLSVAGAFDLVAFAREPVAQRDDQTLLIFDDEDSSLHASPSSAGIRIVNAAPSSR